MIAEVNGKTKVLGLIGKPVEHTLSPVIHNTLAGILDDNLMYIPLEVADPDRIGDAIKGAYALGISGLNVTVPYKSAVIPYLKEIDPVAEKIGAVNTLVRVEGGYKGYNTDYEGLRRALETNGAGSLKNVVIIGAGGASRAAAFMCGVSGAEHVVILNRTVTKAQTLAKEVAGYFPDMTIEAMSIDAVASIPMDHFIAIQCTNVGLHPNVENSPITDPLFFEKATFVYDAIYKPAKTKFMSLAEDAYVPACCGIDMLLWQGIAAYELWNMKSVDLSAVDEVRALLLEKTKIAEPANRDDGPKTSECASSTQPIKLKNIVLVGFMGSGKTTVGRKLSKETGMPMADLDEMIEKEAGMTITEIFRKEGETGFRARESALLQKLLTEQKEGMIYSTGGGIVTEKKNRELLHQLGTVVLLQILPETVVVRLGKDTKRPLLQGEDRMMKVRTLMVRRKEAYEAAADLTIEVDKLSPSEIAGQILDKVSLS